MYQFDRRPTVELTDEQIRGSIIQGIASDLITNKQYYSNETKSMLFGTMKHYMSLMEFHHFVKHYKTIWPASEELEFESCD